MVTGSWSEHLRRLGGGSEPCRHRGVPTIRLLRCNRVPLLHQLKFYCRDIVLGRVEVMRHAMHGEPRRIEWPQ